MKKRTIEVFTAGCPVCQDTVELVRRAVGQCGCELIEHRCEGDTCCAEATKYGIRTLPTLVVDGSIVFEGRISQAQAALLSN